MKLLTHNMLTSKCIKGVNVGYPLGIVIFTLNTENKRNKSLPSLNTSNGKTSFLIRTSSMWLYCSVHNKRSYSEKKVCVNRIGYALDPMAKDVRVSELEFNQEFVARMINKIDWNALYNAADGLGHATELPKAIVDDFESNEDFLKKVHHVLLEVEVINGELVCPETGRRFPISAGIPNMLLNEDEV